MREAEPECNGRRCELCRNTGLVTIWHPLVTRGVHQGVRMFRGPNGSVFRIYNEDGSLKKLTAVAPCNCSLGKKFQTKMVKKGDHWEQEDVRPYLPAHFHARIQDRSLEERSSMTTFGQVVADIEAAGIGVKECDF